MRHFLDWEQIDWMVDTIAWQIKASKEEFDGVYGIPRGGLILAVMLSHRLNLKLLDKPTSKTLICDDISDTGKTLGGFNAKIACISSSKWTKVIPDYFVYTKTNKNSWIVFPWENKEIEGK